MRSRPLLRVEITLFALSLMAGSCNHSPEGTAPKKGGTEGRVEWIDPKTIQPGPIQRDSLTEEQMARIRTLQATFAEVDGQTVEKWVDNFKRDADPDQELRVWERMSKAYRRYCDGRKLSQDAKKEVYRVVLLRSMTSEKEVLEKIKLKELKREEAAQAIKDY